MLTTSVIYPQTMFDHEPQTYPAWFKNERYYLCESFGTMIQMNRKNKKKSKRL